MAISEELKWEIDWWLPKSEFVRLIDEMIKRAVAEGKILALPLQIYSGQVYHDYMTLLLAQVHCGACDAPCCKKNSNNEPTALLAPEYRRLVKKYGASYFVIIKGQAFLPMPCPFLKNDKCTIYEDRPLICVCYPFQPGATDSGGNGMMALASSCPEARRITRRIYMSAWWIRHQFRLLEEADVKRKEENSEH